MPLNNLMIHHNQTIIILSHYFAITPLRH
jgi:hypothetical protein